MSDGGKVLCRVCGSADVRSLGRPRYRPPTKVAGVPIRIDDLNLFHYRCTACDYQFVAPVVPEERLLACYRESSGKNWTTDPAVDASIAHHRFYANKKAVLERFSPGKRVLDFGCYDGGFLSYLGDAWDKSGIEPSTVAADLAASHGVRIIRPTIDAVGGEYDQSFDAVVSFDVLEHLPDPVQTLTSLTRLLKPGGVMVVETGDSGNLAWRLSGPAYWYCGIVEHIGFFNRQSVATAGKLAGLELLHFERTRHSRYAGSERFRGVAVTAAYLGLRALRAMRVPLPTRLKVIAEGINPTHFGSRDHFLAVLRRPT